MSSISADQNLLTGVFENAYMVTNAGSASTSRFTGCVGDGRAFSMADSTVTLTLNIEVYEGIFVIPFYGFVGKWTCRGE